MGLVDDVRKRRDSWIKRFEEHRQEEYETDSNTDPEKEEKRIMENRRKVGVFPKKDQDD
ncbi:MAG: hypothetical protein RIG61_07920 [Deltaproteobacteria bacterium]